MLLPIVCALGSGVSSWHLREEDEHSEDRVKLVNFLRPDWCSRPPGCCPAGRGGDIHDHESVRAVGDGDGFRTPRRHSQQRCRAESRRPPLQPRPSHPHSVRVAAPIIPPRTFERTRNAPQSAPGFFGRGQSQNETAVAVNPLFPRNTDESERLPLRRWPVWGQLELRRRADLGKPAVPSGFTAPGFMAPRHYWDAGGDTSVGYDSSGEAYLNCQMFNRGTTSDLGGDASALLCSAPPTAERPGAFRRRPWCRATAPAPTASGSSTSST